MTKLFAAIGVLFGLVVLLLVVVDMQPQIAAELAKPGAEISTFEQYVAKHGDPRDNQMSESNNWDDFVYRKDQDPRVGGHILTSFYVDGNDVIRVRDDRHANFYNASSTGIDLVYYTKDGDNRLIPNAEKNAANWAETFNHVVSIGIDSITITDNFGVVSVYQRTAQRKGRFPHGL